MHDCTQAVPTSQWAKPGVLMTCVSGGCKCVLQANMGIQYLAVPSPCSTPLDAKCGPLRGLPDTCHNFFVQMSAQCLAQTHCSCAFAFTQRCWGHATNNHCMPNAQSSHCTKIGLCSETASTIISHRSFRLRQKHACSARSA